MAEEPKTATSFVWQTHQNTECLYREWQDGGRRVESRKDFYHLKRVCAKRHTFLNDDRDILRSEGTSGAVLIRTKPL